MEGVYTLPVIYALAGSEPLRRLLAQPLDADRLAEAREPRDHRTARSTPPSASPATTRRRPATRSPAPRVSTPTCAPRWARLVGGLVERDS